jgi:limonene-1,2-epoxide hydrolase
LSGSEAVIRDVKGIRVSDSPESVVRKFLGALEDPSKPDEIADHFADDGVYADPRGVHRGIDAIRAEFRAQAAMGFENVKVDVISLVADGGTVMAERIDSWTVGDQLFTIEMLGSFEVDTDGRIKRWRDYNDLKSITDQIEAPAG